MREILFKAKRIDNGEWVEGYYCLTTTYARENKRKPVIIVESDLCNSCLWTNDDVLEVYEVNPDTICQYTGLTDKNGNKIWENDVARYYDDLAEMEKEDLIKWNETHASFIRLHESKMGLQYLYIDECIANRTEVIGNIFDNPELLERN